MEEQINKIKEENEKLKIELERIKQNNMVCHYCDGQGYYSIFPENWSGICSYCSGTGINRY